MKCDRLWRGAMCNRRNFLKTFTLTALATQLPLLADAKNASKIILKPSRLKVGDTVGLISPGSYVKQEDIDQFKQTLTNLGLKVKLGKHILNRYGYLAGTDLDRAADVNAMFADNSVQAIFTMRGGWGCNRILPLIDYGLIRKYPKILIGFSDITSLLLAIYAKTGVITFHGAVGTSSWNSFTVDYLKSILFNGEAVSLKNSSQILVETITPGKARGKLLGGNLSVLAAMVGSNYLPDWQGSILFLEEISEEPYRVDRMLTQLKLAGILDKISGFIFGQCSDCVSKDEDESLTISQVIRDRIVPLGIPAWYGSNIGHIKDKFTLAVGAEVEINATAGTIQMLEKAVR